MVRGDEVVRRAVATAWVEAPRLGASVDSRRQGPKTEGRVGIPYPAFGRSTSCPRGFLAVDHPRDAEPVGEHAEADQVPGLADRHLDRAALGQGREQALRLVRRADLDRHVAALDPF